MNPPMDGKWTFWFYIALVGIPVYGHCVAALPKVAAKFRTEKESFRIKKFSRVSAGNQSAKIIYLMPGNGKK